MKRDWDVIRDVLIEVEEFTDEARTTFEYRDQNKDDPGQVKAKHAILLNRAGFLDGVFVEYLDGASVLVSPNLTWKGHELLDTLRSKPIWEKIKTTAKDKGIELSFEAVIGLGKMVLAAMIGGSVST